jgi:hypothetical protein
LRQPCWKQHCCSSVTTTCERPVENSSAAALSQQLVTDLLTGRCGPVRTDRYKASERIQVSACWQQVLTDLLKICSDLREIGCVPWLDLSLYSVLVTSALRLYLQISFHSISLSHSLSPYYCRPVIECLHAILTGSFPTLCLRLLHS